MKLQLIILGAFIALTHKYATARKEEDIPVVQGIASNPTVPVWIDGGEKKKNLISRKSSYLRSFLHRAGLYVKNSLLSAFKPLSSKATDFEISEDQSSDIVMQDPDSQINDFPTIIRKKCDNSYKPPKPTPEIYTINNIRPSFIPYTEDVAEITVDPRKVPRKKTDLEKGFYEQFKKHTKKVYNTKDFIRKGIVNAKKNLLLQTRLARAYTSAAAHKTMDVFKSTLRSSHLLGDLVKKGLITPHSAAKELAYSVKDMASEYLDASARNMKGASNYLLHTAVGSVDGIINGLKDAPSAAPGLLRSYEDVFTNDKYKFHEAFPALASAMEMDARRLKGILHPHGKKPMGEVWNSMQEVVGSLKEQWSKLGTSLFGDQDERYKTRFISLTEDLARTLDALSSHLGKGIKMQVPGVDALRYRFKCILEELKKKNGLTMTGKLGFKELMEYSIRVFSQLKEIDKAILGIVPSKQPHPFNITENPENFSNPLSPLSGYNSIGKRAFKELKDARADKRKALY